MASARRLKRKLEKWDRWHCNVYGYRPIVPIDFHKAHWRIYARWSTVMDYPH